MPARAPRTILHADLDAFYAAVEQLDDPALKGRPVIVGGLGRRGVVATASYEARAFGVRSAMPTATARRICPHAVYLHPRIARYAELGRTVREIFDGFSPAVEPLSLDEAFIDLGPLPAHEDGVRRARALKDAVRQATGLVVSVGVAGSKYVAKVASDLGKPDGLLAVRHGEEEAFLAPLPTSRLWGAGPRTVERLTRFSMTRIGDLVRATPDALALALGNQAPFFLALARGDDPRPVEPDRERRSIGKELTFETDLTDAAACRAVLAELAEGVGRRLRREGLAARVLRVKLRHRDFETHTRQRRLERPVDDDVALHREAMRLFEASWDGARGLRLLGVTAAELQDVAEGLQLDLFQQQDERARSMQRVVDAIRSRFGEDAIGRGRAAPTPERSGYEAEDP